MAEITAILIRDRADGACLEITACEHEGSEYLSPGFSITAALWEATAASTGRQRLNQGIEPEVVGQLHPEILDVAPELEPLVDVHLANPQGIPLHAEVNGWYFYSGQAAAWERESIAAGRDHGYSQALRDTDHDRAARALHIPADQLPTSLDYEAFRVFVKSLQMTYLRRARNARVLLAELISQDTATQHAV